MERSRSYFAYQARMDTEERLGEYFDMSEGALSVCADKTRRKNREKCLIH